MAASLHNNTGQITKAPVAQRTRIWLLSSVLFAGYAAIAVKLVELSSYETELRERQALAQTQSSKPSRADILDARGEILATNVISYSVVANPKLVRDHAKAAKELAGVLNGVSEERIYNNLTKGRQFAWVKREISPREQVAVLDLGIYGVSLKKEQRRVYPKNEMASHLVGYVNVDGDGLAGIEYAEQEQLKTGDRPLELTVDSLVQQVAEEALGFAYHDLKAEGACAIVMDVRSRAVKAMVSLPHFNPNRIKEAKPAQKKNSCSGSVFELGSVFKAFTAAMALDSGLVSIHDRFDAIEPVRYNGHRIRDDHAHKRWLSFPEVVAFSSNIGTTQMAFMAGGAPILKSFLDRIGLLSRRQNNLLEIQAPLIPRKWPDITVATVSFGHGISVSALQFTEALAALVDDGKFAYAHFTKDGGTAPQDRQPVISQKTVDDLRFLLWATVERGTGSALKSGRYLVGGKTGTADKTDNINGGYLKDAVIASFFGVFPIEDPKFVVFVSIDDPKANERTHGFRYGSQTAAPVVKTIINYAGPILGVEPSEPQSLAAFESRVLTYTAFNGRTKREEEGFEAIAPTR